MFSCTNPPISHQNHSSWACTASQTASACAAAWSCSTRSGTSSRPRASRLPWSRSSRRHAARPRRCRPGSPRPGGGGFASSWLGEWRWCPSKWISIVILTSLNLDYVVVSYSMHLVINSSSSSHGTFSSSPATLSKLCLFSLSNSKCLMYSCMGVSSSCFLWCSFMEEWRPRDCCSADSRLLRLLLLMFSSLIDKVKLVTFFKSLEEIKEIIKLKLSFLQST